MRYTLSKKQRIYLPFKRLIDIVGSFIGIVFCFIFLWWWVVLINSIVTKGHPFFLNERIGKNNKPFKLIKFRSMKVGVDPTVAAIVADTNSMVTPFGRFLRKASLDETTQLINIFLGQMSFIGPRPLIDNPTDHITIVIRQENGADQVRPGLSGYAQINGRSFMAPEVKGNLDGYYVAHLSFAMDLKTFFLTFARINGKKNKGK